MNVQLKRKKGLLSRICIALTDKYNIFNISLSMEYILFYYNKLNTLLWLA